MIGASREGLAGDLVRAGHVPGLDEADLGHQHRPGAPKKVRLAHLAQPARRPSKRRAKSFGVYGLGWRSAGHVSAHLSPARSDRCGSASSLSCHMSGVIGRPPRMGAALLSSTCMISRAHHSRGGFQHLPNNFLRVRDNPSCTLESGQRMSPEKKQVLAY